MTKRRFSTPICTPAKPTPRALYKVSAKIETFDSSLRPLVRDMFDTMYEARGVGLAGVQIGVLKRLLVIDLEDMGFTKGVFINPVVAEASDEIQQGEEGCLSVPGLAAQLDRPKWVKVKYQNIAGEENFVEGEMLMARALLHEMDHLDGKVFVDQLEPDLRLELQDNIELIKQGKEPSNAVVPDYRR